MINFFPEGTVVRTYSGEWMWVTLVNHYEDTLHAYSIFGGDKWYDFDMMGVGIGNNYILDVNSIGKYRKVWFSSLRTPKLLDKVEVNGVQGIVTAVDKSMKRARVTAGKLVHWVN